MRYLFFAALSIPLLCSAQHTRQLGAFSALSVTGNIELTLVPGESPELTLLDEEVEPDAIQIKLSREKLQIRHQDPLLLADGNPIRLVVAYSHLKAVTAHLGAELRSDHPLHSEDLLVRSTSGAEVALELYTNALDAGAFEGAELRLSGEAFSQKAAATTGGIYRADDLACRRAQVKAHTGGEAWLSASESLKASANTGGVVYYYGKPETVSVRNGLSGEVEQVGEALPMPGAQ